MRIPGAVLTLAFVLSFVALAFGLFLHALTYFGVDARDFIPIVWYSYQIATALLFIPLMLSGMRAGPEATQVKSVSPRLLLACAGFFLVYAIFNWIFTSMVLTRGETPAILDGHYVLTSHGFSSPITYAEFRRYRVYEARENSGHWMFLWSWTAIWCCDHMITRTAVLRHSVEVGPGKKA